MHVRIHELLEHLDAQRRDLREAFEAVPRNLRDVMPAPGRWSAANVIEHVAMVESRLAGRLSASISEARARGLEPERDATGVLNTFDLSLMKDRTSRRSAPEPVQPTGLTADDAWRSLEEATVALHAAILEGEGLALGTVSVEHPVFGSISLYHYIAILGAHEGRHAAQLREIAEALEART